MAVGVVLLDFDGTLAHRPGMWSQCVLDVLDELMPDNEMTIEDIRPHLRNGFPWHQSEDPHPQLNERDEWWHHVGTLFVQAFRALGVDEGRLSEGVAAVRTRYCDPGRFQLFPDTIPALRALRARGWSTVILSNHVPELPSIVEGLGLGQFVDDTLSSACTGFESRIRRPSGSVCVAWMPRRRGWWETTQSQTSEVQKRWESEPFSYGEPTPP